MAAHQELDEFTRCAQNAVRREDEDFSLEPTFNAGVLMLVGFTKRS